MFGVRMPPEVVKRLLDAMAVHGIIRITFDPFEPNPELEVWTRTNVESIDRVRETILLNESEKKYFIHEYMRYFNET